MSKPTSIKAPPVTVKANSMASALMTNANQVASQAMIHTLVAAPLWGQAMVSSPITRMEGGRFGIHAPTIETSVIHDITTK